MQPSNYTHTYIHTYYLVGIKNIDSAQENKVQKQKAEKREKGTKL